MSRHNFDHTHCTHPRTAAGRAACRKARAGKDVKPGKAIVERIEDDSLPTITRKEGSRNRGKWVRVTTKDDVIFSGVLTAWGPQVLVIEPDEATQTMLSRKWKRESIPTVTISTVEVER